MKTLIVLLLTGSGMLIGAEELKMFAPAVDFVQVEWLGTNVNGIPSWVAGADGTPNPRSIGEIHQGRVTGWQQLSWGARTYDIRSVTKTPEGVIEVVFGNGKLLMTRTADGFYLVDVLPPESNVPVARFRTTRKAMAHDGGEAR